MKIHFENQIIVVIAKKLIAPDKTPLLEVLGFFGQKGMVVSFGLN